jgi:hypothetical protein
MEYLCDNPGDVKEDSGTTVYRGLGSKWSPGTLIECARVCCGLFSCTLILSIAFNVCGAIELRKEMAEYIKLRSEHEKLRLEHDTERDRLKSTRR